MGREQRQQGRASVLKRLRRPQMQSTSISSSAFSATDQQHKDRDSLMNQIPNNNKRSKLIRRSDLYKREGQLCIFYILY